MRLQPVASQAVRRVAVRDVQLRDGRTIPAGTTITGSNYSLMRNPAWWGPDAGDFKPVRAATPLTLNPSHCF